jgi:lipopolysaccharide/colanic/teichoic acid biosynthesis glycosyltransferase
VNPVPDDPTTRSDQTPRSDPPTRSDPTTRDSQTPRDDRATRSARTKRAFDLLVAIPLLVLTLPIQLATAIAIRLRLGSPVIFRHTRPGLHGQPFDIVKFRTMLNVDPDRGLTDDASRLTPLGLWLRATSLDELPTLWNVVRGDLSLVGPRPLMMNYLGRYSPEQSRRHDVRPGVTGLAQVSGRNALGWEEKFRLDVYYVDHHTFVGDLKILLRTVRSVVRRDGISEAGETTSSEFMGTDAEGTASHDTASHDTVSHDTVSHDTVSHDTVSHDTVSHDTVSHDTVSQDTADHRENA